MKTKYCMKLLTACLLYVSIACAGTTAYPPLIHNAVNETAIPKMFRMSTQVFDDKEISDAGLSTLNASASGQFSVLGLQTMIKVIPVTDITIIDLREESHGFLNGDGVSWYGYRNWANRGKSLDDIQNDEQQRLQFIFEEKKATVQTKNIPRIAYEVDVEEVLTEQAVAQAQGVNYIRLPITDHLRPEDSDVDQFLEIVKAFPDSSWLHFHCAAGKGRASTFFVMYDMYRNAKVAACNDIILRQELIGGKDLSEYEDDDWKTTYAAERLDFLKNFHRYCKDENPDKQSWSEWISSQQN